MSLAPSAAPGLPGADTTRGLTFAVAAVTIFAAQDGISRHMAEHYPVPLITMYRYWAFALFAALFAARQAGGLRAAARTRRPVLQWARGALLSVQIFFALTAFASVGLAQTQAVFAAAPLFVALLSMPVLGERVGWRRWVAIGVGMIGVMLILRPGVGVFDPMALFAVAGCVGMAIYGVLTRLVSRDDPSHTSFFYTGVAGCVVATAAGPFFWVPMAWPDVGWMLVLCVTGTTGHYLFIRALDAAPAVVVQPVSYLQLVLVTIIGITVFGESPHPLTFAGATLVVAAGLFTAWREHVASRRAARR